MKKKLYKTIITVEVISDEPYNGGLGDLAYDTTEGDCSGAISWGEPTELVGMDAVKALEEQGSEPEFFGMDSEGNEEE